MTCLQVRPDHQESRSRKISRKTHGADLPETYETPTNNTRIKHRAADKNPSGMCRSLIRSLIIRCTTGIGLKAAITEPLNATQSYDVGFCEPTLKTMYRQITTQIQTEAYSV